MIDLEQAILELVRRPGYQPIKPRVIAKRLGVAKDEADEIKKIVKRLVRQGQLAYGASHLVKAGPLAPPVAETPVASAEAAEDLPETAQPKKRRTKQVVGVFRRTEGGYGFVRPQRIPGEEPMADVFIPARHTSDAATGDQVAVRLRKEREHGRRRADDRPGLRGEIVEILRRETRQFVGTLLEKAGAAYVQVDGNMFQQPVYVGDPGSKNAQPNDKVVFEMVRFPSALRDGEGVITEVLGARGQPGVDTLSILREFDLPEQFPDEVLREARQQAKEFERLEDEIPSDRLDLTGLTVLTIDPIDARDFDDAISLEQTDGGGWRLGVHIADVSHFVQPKTALDAEAFERATSVYLPDRVIPMLPELISNGLASLQPDKNRFAKTIFLDFAADGLRVASELHSTVIRSRKRLTYEQVDEYLENPDAWPERLGPQVHALLGRMHTLAMILRRRRLARGALELTMPEVKVDLDADGRVVGAHVQPNTVSHQIIEEFMLAANEAVAETLRDRGLFFLRRIHASPSPQKLKALSEFVSALGIENDGLESRFELQKLLEKVAGQPEQNAVNYSVLRSMQRAVYGPAEEGHYALASDCYCHFTSPIRRYPDLTIHRLVQAILTRVKPRNNVGELTAYGEHCSERERQAEQAERELTKIKLLAYLSDRIGEEMDAVITGVESYGLFAQGISLPAEGLIRVDSLVDDYYRYDRGAHTLAGYRSGNSYRLGDQVRVAVARVDVDRRELDFRLIRHRGRPERPKLRVPRSARPGQPKRPRKPEKSQRKARRRKA